VNESRKTCDASSSQRRRIEIVFTHFCKKYPERMTVSEYASLCKKFNAFKEGAFTIGDVYLLFRDAANEDQCLELDQFMRVTAEVGERTGIGREIFARLADAAENLDVDEAQVSRIRLKLKGAAVSARVGAAGC